MDNALAVAEASALLRELIVTRALLLIKRRRLSTQGRSVGVGPDGKDGIVVIGLIVGVGIGNGVRPPSPTFFGSSPTLLLMATLELPCGQTRIDPGWSGSTREADEPLLARHPRA